MWGFAELMGVIAGSDMSLEACVLLGVECSGVGPFMRSAGVV